jgi:hypothetical protein
LLTQFNKAKNGNWMFGSEQRHHRIMELNKLSPITAHWQLLDCRVETENPTN